MGLMQEKRVPNAIFYRKPRRVWDEDGHVFAEGDDGAVLQMEPEVAIHLGRLLEAAGTESFINKVTGGLELPQ
jgi:hypothetical protein